MRRVPRCAAASAAVSQSGNPEAFFDGLEDLRAGTLKQHMAVNRHGQQQLNIVGGGAPGFVGRRRVPADGPAHRYPLWVFWNASVAG
jgi:hypothetical protein